MSLLKTIGSILDKGADYAIAREQAKDDNRLPAGYQTPAEAVVQNPAPRALVENDRIVGTETSAQSYLKPVLIGVVVATLSGLLAAGVRSAMKGGRK